MRIFIIAVFLAFLAQAAWAGETAYEDTLAGKKCAEHRQQINCEYKVGKDLEFSIDGIGMPDTGITFTRTKGLQGDYYATVGIMHGCIIIKPGAKSKLFGTDFAFVSPKNGKVYRTWQECQAGY
jgi:hypothetical protein